MTVSFILNGEDVVVHSEPNARLIDVIRKDFGLLGAKTGCGAGRCGLCSVIINGAVCQACLIPVFKLHGSEIITIEGFSQTDDYQDIVTGFELARLETCGFCRAGKILCAAALLGQKENPEREDILSGFSGIQCRCTESNSLAEALAYCAQIRQRRLYGRSS
jgi:carbon-monoxide dehydrogenase small subunit